MAIKRKTKETIKERVEELEAEVRWLNWLVDKHIYQENPKYYFTEVYPKPNPLTGWKVTS